MQNCELILAHPGRIGYGAVADFRFLSGLWADWKTDLVPIKRVKSNLFYEYNKMGSYYFHLSSADARRVKAIG